MPRSKILENPHIGANAPTTLYVGRIWHEISNTGVFVGSWIWNSTYWLSLETFSHYVTTGLTSAVAVLVYPLDPAFNIFLLNTIATIQASALATAANNWSWEIGRMNSANGLTVLATGNNIGQTANSWQTFKTPINLHINLSSPGTVGLRLREIRTGTINKTGSVGFEYRKVRI
jgi:hypothetical protein